MDSAARSVGELEFNVVSAASGGFVAGKYRVFATLGRGGMADVYLSAAQGPAGFNKLVVIKKLREARVGDPTYVRMFLDEARLAARINHPNVVHTYEIGEDGDGYFIAMEYLEGQPLNRVAHAMRLRGEPMEPALAAHLMAEALLGLHHAHDMKDYDGTPLAIVHRDISPQNLHVTYDGQMRVLDFGIAKAALNTSQTPTGFLKGKFSYMSPEQALGEGVDRRSDVYGAGIVLWEVLAGERLFKGDNAVVLAKLLTSNARAPSEVNPAVPPALDAIVLKALTRHPESRYQSALDMANALEDFVQSSGTRVRREDVARKMSEVFGDIRTQLQKEIQSHMATLSATSGEVAALVSTASNTASIPSSTSGVIERVSTVASADRPPVVAPPEPARASNKHRTILLVAAGLASVAVIGLLARLVMKPLSPTASAQAPAETAKVVGGAVAAAVPVAATAQGETESFHLTLSSDPLEAQVEWVGKPVGQTPMMIDLLSGPQTFILSKEGFFNATVVVNVKDNMAGLTQSRTVVLVPRSKGAVAAAAPAKVVITTSEPMPSRAKSTPAQVEGLLPARTSAPEIAAPLALPKAAEPEPVAAVAAPPPAAPPVEAPPPRAAPVAAPPPAAAPTTPTVLPFGPEMSRPVLISGSDPIYTREAIVAGVEGTIIAKCTITTAGSLEHCRILKGLPYMDKAMLDALATRKYTPVMYRGAPVAVEYVFNVKLVKR